MMTAARYEIIQRLYESPTVAVWRARDTRDDSPVILKQARWGGGDRGRIRHELEILRGLEGAHLVRARGVEEHAGAPALVLEDFGGESLDRVLSRRRLDLETTLRLSVQIAAALDEVHRGRVLHRDVNPSNILVKGLQRVQLIDFNIAARLPRDSQGLESTDRLEGTLPFISPEQTGRIHRLVDQRTDLYSLGATLYVMLTGQPPFPSSEPMEIIYGHLARRPAAPAELDPSVPAVVSEIVMKLLAKSPEERYRTALGARTDLMECLARLERDGAITPFPIGRYDVLDRLRIPDRLYGRGQDIAALEDAFARVSGGSPEMVLVSGYAGVGKSALIRTLERAVVERRGYFIPGKFEQFKRDIPYSALLEAFGRLMRQILAESESSVAAWREALARALDGVGRVLIDVLPEAEFLLDQGPPPVELPAAAAEKRFRGAILALVQAITGRGLPLAIFLDDLQWADTGTLELLPLLLGDAKAGSVLLIGAYRDTEVSLSHPLRTVLAQIEKTHQRATQIALGPLALGDVIAFTADALELDRHEVRSIAEIAWRKTQGNPFFTAELLKSLERTGLLWFDPEAQRFRWDVEQLEGAPISENVVALMTARVRSLGREAQALLEIAALLGGSFALETLATAAERGCDDAARLLGEAIEIGLVLPLGEAQTRPESPTGEYRFLHDRVQQAVVEGIAGAARGALHLRVGRLLLRSAPPTTAQGERLFEIVHHLNLAADLVESREERLEIARQNLSAGRRAMASAAFASAATYFSAGIRVLPEDAWRREHALAYELHVGLAECESVRGRIEAAEQVFEVLLRVAPSDMDKARLLSRRAVLHRHVAKVNSSVHLALDAVELLGMKISARPSKAFVLAEIVKTRRALRGRSPAELLALPEMTDPRKRLTVAILGEALTTAGHASPELFAVMMLKMVAISAEHGNTSASAPGYGCYGTVLMAALGDYAQADAFGRLSLALAERYPDKENEAQVKAGYCGVMHHFRHPVAEALPILNEAVRLGMESGGFTHAAYALSSIARAEMWRCRSLPRFREELAAWMDAMVTTEVTSSLEGICVVRQFALALQGLTRSPTSFDTRDFDEERYAATFAAYEGKMLLYIYCTYKLKLLFLHGRPDEALAVAERASSKTDETLFWTIELPTYYFYFALALAAAAERADLLARQRMLVRLRMILRKLKRWAENAPFNFGHQHELAAAELSRVTGDDRAAIRQYERAIKLAREQDLPLDEALAEELAGRFYRARGADETAMAYLARARQSYERLGATVKVAMLDAQHPGLSTFLVAGQHGQGVTPSVSTTITSNAGSGVLDAPSLIKASQALSSEIDLRRLLTRLMEIVVENAGAERGALLLGKGQELRVVAEISAERGAAVPAAPPLLSERDDLASGIIQYAVRTQKSVILTDAAREGEFTRDAYVEKVKPRSLLCMPVRHQGDPKGVLCLENNMVVGAFSAERVELLSVVCAQMAISIENATMYGSLERRVLERTRELREAQEQIVKLEKAATEMQMAGGFAHEMRNTLSAAKLLLTGVYRASDGDAAGNLCDDNIDLMKDVFQRVRGRLSGDDLAPVAQSLKRMKGNEGKVREVLDGIDTSLRRALSLTDRLLRYARIGSERPGGHAVHVLPLVESVLQESTADLAAKGIAVDVAIPAGAEILGREPDLYSIVKNLVLNARDAVVEQHDGRERKIRITLSEGVERSTLSVEDSGVGITPEHKARIFEPFFSTKPDTGTGLGLPIVQRTVEMYQGTIEVESELGRGSIFRITLPRPGAAAPLPSVRPPAPRHA